MNFTGLLQNELTITIVQTLQNGQESEIKIEDETRITIFINLLFCALSCLRTICSHYIVDSV